MTDQEKDKIKMLSGTPLYPYKDVELQGLVTRSPSMSMPVSLSEREDFLPHTGPFCCERASQFLHMGNSIAHNKGKKLLVHKDSKLHSKSNAIMPEEMGPKDWLYNNNAGRNENLLKSGHLGLCSNPYCIDCPADCHAKATDSKFHNNHFKDANRRGRESFSLANLYFPIMNPHAKVVQQWNRVFFISCLVAIFVDPLFFFLFSTNQDNKCAVLNWSQATAVAIVRSFSDFIYLLHILLQFRLAYIAPESRVVGAGDLVDRPTKIILHYLRGYFILDLFVVLPLPQVMILVVIPNYMGSSSANFAKNLLRATVLLQYIPRIFRFLPLLAGQSPSGFIFVSGWANFFINLLMFILAGHVVGSCWYLFTLQRLNQCLQEACSASNITYCKRFIDCGRGKNMEEFNSMPSWQDWLNDNSSSNCFSPTTNFAFGLYQNAVLLTTEKSIFIRYTYSLFWGLQQVSTFAGNQVPSYFLWEAIFIIVVMLLGLLLFALLITIMQNFLMALGRRYILGIGYTCSSRTLEMQIKRRDFERWMSYRHLPEELRRKVREAERFNWAATRGVNEKELLENLPHDLQRELRRHLFKFLKKVHIFTILEDHILDTVCEKLSHELYIRGTEVLYQQGPVEKMVFIVRGQMESIGADGTTAPLSEGDVCGEELLTWYLEHSSVNRGGKIRFPGQRLSSNRTVKCLTNVEAFVLLGADLEKVTALFARFLRNPRVQGVIRYESPYWRTLAATRIQVAWRYRQRCLKWNSIYNQIMNMSSSRVS